MLGRGFKGVSFIRKATGKVTELPLKFHVEDASDVIARKHEGGKGLRSSV